MNGIKEPTKAISCKEEEEKKDVEICEEKCKKEK